jgi:type IX secretion system PorP/SprF family membrane protein
MNIFMNNKKSIGLNLTLIAIFCAFAKMATAQQELRYTQFMYNKQSYNPGYVGSSNAACFTGIYRNQWIGFEGAPTTQVLTFGMPLSNGRIGVGGNISHASVGIENRVTIDGAYTYRIPLGSGNLGVGLQASVRYRGINFNDARLISLQPAAQDAAIALGAQSKYVPNFGVGAYYNNERFFVGLSAPRLLKNTLNFSEKTSTLATEERHLYLMGGVLLPISASFAIQPQFLVQYVNRAPLSVELNANVIYNDKYTAGLTYRPGGTPQNGVGESLVFLVAGQLGDRIMLGVSYDTNLSKVRTVNDGSIELTLRYCMMQAEGNDFINPRFF